MLKLSERVSAFEKLGHYLRSFGEESTPDAEGLVSEKFNALKEVVQNLYHYNGWFVEANVREMLLSIGNSLEKSKLEKWIAFYSSKFETPKKEKTVAVIMAGNIPAVGFHDFLTVLISGNKILAKLSSDDKKLLPAISDLLIAIEPRFNEKIEFTTETINQFDAVIATGSNNSSRYFEHYFGKYPCIIRKNRNGVALVSGTESHDELEGLADDMLGFFGLGCRNVSKVYLPIDYDFEGLLEIVSKRTDVVENSKYFNNYEYNKALFLVNGRSHYDTGTLLMVEDRQLASPVSVVFYEYYQSLDELLPILNTEKDNIQCLVSSIDQLPGKIAFGKSQQPELWDYADGIDSLDFLLGLN